MDGSSKDAIVCVRFSDETMKAMGAIGDRSRSDFVREAVADALKRRNR